MPFRLYRRRRIAPGVRLNLSKSGPSLTFGGRGFHYTVGHHRRRTTIGIPGTGLSYTAYSHTHARAAARGRSLPPVRPARTGPSALQLLVGLFTRRGRVHRLLARAHTVADLATAGRLIASAAAILPDDPEVIGTRATWTEAQGNWVDACTLFARYLALVPRDLAARVHFAKCLLQLGHPDECISQLALVRPLLPAEDDQANVVTFLALAFMAKGDASQALALLQQQPLQRRQLSPVLQQCLRMRAFAHHLLGQRAAALHDLERLYALNPDYPGVQQDRSEIEAGTFVLDCEVGPIGRTGLTPTRPIPPLPPAPPPPPRP